MFKHKYILDESVPVKPRFGKTIDDDDLDEDEDMVEEVIEDEQDDNPYNLLLDMYDIIKDTNNRVEQLDKKITKLLEAKKKKKKKKQGVFNIVSMT